MREHDDAVGGAPVALVSHETWVARFASDPAAVGRVVQIDTTRYTIVGVLPPGLTLDRNATRAAYWIPAGQDPQAWLDRGSYAFHAIGRLKQSVSLSAATAESGRFFSASSGDNRVTGALLATLQDDQTRTVRRPLLILLAASGLLLLIACINVATLLMGEAASREDELRTRTALGASRGRLVRQLLTESVVLAGAGARLRSGARVRGHEAHRSVGAAVDPRTWRRPRRRARARRRADRGRRDRAVVRTGARVVADAPERRRSEAAFVSAATTRAAGDERSACSSPARSRCRWCCSWRPDCSCGASTRCRMSDFARHSSRRAFTSTSPESSDSVRVRALYRDVLDRLKRMPGVASASATSIPPFSRGSSTGSFEVEGHPVAPGSPAPTGHRRMTTPEFFATAGIPIIAGRAYSDADRGDAPPVVVVSRTLARSEWPTETAVGKRIKLFGQWRTVVGVAGDILTGRPSADAPERHLRAARAGGSRRRSVARRAHAQCAVTPSPAIRRVVHDVAPDVTVSRRRRMDALVAASLADDRLRTVLISLFGVLAALLAAVGMYGVAATAASRRTREMAIRAAIGASSGSIARLIVGGAAAGVAFGALAGVGLALAGTRVLSPYLYGVGPVGPGRVRRRGRAARHHDGGGDVASRPPRDARAVGGDAARGIGFRAQRPRGQGVVVFDCPGVVLRYLSNHARLSGIASSIDVMCPSGVRCICLSAGGVPNCRKSASCDVSYGKKVS